MELIKYQLSLISKIKSLTPWRWEWLTISNSILLWIVNAGYLIISISFIYYAFRYRKLKNIFISLTIVYSWIFAVFGKNVTYFLFPLPFVYLGAFMLLENLSNKNLVKKIIITCIVFIMIANLNLLLNNYLTLSGDKYNYRQYINSLFNIIPDNTNILYSAIPIPDFGFIDSGRHNILYVVPQVPTDNLNFLNILNKIDYVIFNGYYNMSLENKLYFINYIQNNTEKEFQIGNTNQYKVYIYKLLSQDKRKIN
jgi:hypothetical protein